MGWACSSSAEVDEEKCLPEVMSKEVDLNVLKTDLCNRGCKLGFFDPESPHKVYLKVQLDNGPKHESHICKSWLLYNWKIVLVEELEQISEKYVLKTLFHLVYRHCQFIADANEVHTKY